MGDRVSGRAGQGEEGGSRRQEEAGRLCIAQGAERRERDAPFCESARE